jgi:hypothetical protein
MKNHKDKILSEFRDINQSNIKEHFKNIKKINKFKENH